VSEPNSAVGTPVGGDAVSPIELFFDLVFVFALSQLSLHLRQQLTWRGGAETAVLLVAVFGVWSYTTFEATLIRVGRAQTQWVLLAVMLFGLFMNAAINGAFATSPWAFILPFLAIQIGRPLWTIATAPNRVLHEHYIVMLGWLLASAPLWIAGAATGSQYRLLWWGLAACLDLVGTWLAHPVPGRVLRSENIEFDAEHLVERCRLLLIIALGETVLSTGIAIAAAPTTAMTYLTGTCALITAVALWALYFAGSDHLVNRHVEATTDPILSGRLALSGESVILAGLIALAVGNELVILHPYGSTPLRLALLLFGGPLLYLLMQTGYLWSVTHDLSRARAAGIVVLIGGGGLALVIAPFAALVLVAAILAGLVVAVLFENRAAQPA
jgi:low temperature requirement protein LtrA